MLPRGLGWLKPPQIEQGMCRQQALPRLESYCEGSRVLEEALGRAGDWGEAAWPRVAHGLGSGRMAVPPPHLASFLLPPRSSSSRDRSEKAGDRGDRESRSEKSGDRLERPERGERGERNRSALTKRSFSKETEDRSREREKQGGPEAVRKAASMTEERDRSREPGELGRILERSSGSGCRAAPDPRAPRSKTRASSSRSIAQAHAVRRGAGEEIQGDHRGISAHQ